MKNFKLFAIVATLLLAALASGAWAQTLSTINVGGTDYTLYTGFTATAGTAGTFGYANFVDGNTSTKWKVIKNIGSNTLDFAGGEEDPAYVEFHADAPFIPKGYILTYNSSNANWKPTSWALKAKLNESDNWTTIHSSHSSLGNGSRFEIACNNDGDNKYQYFRFEIYDVGTTYQSVLDELEFYGNISYTHLTVRSATCTELGIKQECWQRDSDGKYFSDVNGTTELDESAVVEPMKAHTCVHHEASATNTEYWQCSVCGKYFSDSGCTNEISEAEATIGVFGELADGRYTLSSQTYTLTDDENTAGYIYVPEGVTATIDLNGHTIDRGLTSAITNGMVIWVAGSLTVTDGGTGGKIKGGMDAGNEHVSCVMVDHSGAAFTLQGGTLIGNTSYQYNSAVYGGNNTSITISGGKITGDARGIYSFGSVMVSGGEISGNTEGIRVLNNYFSVSGAPVITENTGMNVNLGSWKEKINIAGALTEGAIIGVTPPRPTDNAPVTITSGYSTYNSNVSPSTYFSLDNSGQIQTGPTEYMTVVMGWNEDRTEIAVGTAMRTVNFDLQGHGSDIEAVSLLSDYKLIEPTEPTAEGWSFGGWFTDEGYAEANAWDFDSGVTSDMTLYALWTQGQTYRVTLPENMIIVSADNAAVGGKYPSGANIRFKVKSADYVVDGDVKNGEDVLTADGDGIYTITVADADITITATVKKAAEPNKTLSGSESYTAQTGDVLTGSTSGTVTIASGASITLSDVTISGGIICNGTATITLVGTNSVSGATNKAGIQIGGSGTTLTIKGNGSLTANGGDQSAGIGLSRAWEVDNTGGNIVIEGGNITANGGSKWGAGIGTGVIYGNGSAKTARIGSITIKGGTVKATGGTSADGIGTGYTYSGCTNAIGTVTIYDGINMVDASSIKDFANVVYMHGETNVTASKTDYFTIGEDGNRRLVAQKPVIAEIADQAYTGSAITPKPQVTIGSLSLTKGTDYEYSYTNNTNVGTATVTVTFKGDYESLGSVEKEFRIVKQLSHSDITVSDIPNQTYTGSAICPEISVTDGETALILNSDYTVECSDNVNVGTATMTITGMGSYARTVEKTFEIVPEVILVSGAAQILNDQNGTRAEIDGNYSGSEPVNITDPVTVDDVVINRSFTPLKPATLVLPCELPEGTTANADFYQLTDVSQKGCSWWADFNYIGDGVVPSANTPYAVVLHDSVSSGVLRFNLDGKKATCHTNKVDTTYVSDKTWYFVGVYSYKEWKEGNEELGLAYAFAGSDNEGGAAKGEFGKIKLKEGHTPHANPLRSYLRKRDNDVQLEASICRAASVPGLSLAPAYSVQFIPESDDVIEVEFVKRALVNGNGGANEGTTIIKGRYNTRTGEFKVLQTYDLKGRKLNGKPTAKGVYYGKKERRD